MKLLGLLLSLALAQPAFAGATTDELRTELVQSVSQNRWAQAERAFQSLSESKAKMTQADWVMGAQAARAMGDMTAARERLVASLKITEDEAVQAELDAIDAAWSMVSLKLAKDHEGAVPLRPRMPFVDPVQRQALEVAKKALSTDGRFQGLLPVGGYRFGQGEFEVMPGEATKAKL